jgi:phenylacetate-coenzyme A ligase PaaK-like adenylate-forming protein
VPRTSSSITSNPGVGVTAKVVVLPPGSIERSAGKVKRVIDRRSR